MQRNYLQVWLALGALAVGVLLLVGAEPPPLPSAPAPKTVSVTLAWDRSPDTNVTRYRVYWGPAKRSYTNYIETPQTVATISGLVLPQYFAATALDAAGLESEYSAEVGGRPVLVVWAESRTNLGAGQGWTRWTEWTEAVVDRARLPGGLYLRLGLTNEWR